jgi:hypothetical protein
VRPPAERTPRYGAVGGPQVPCTTEEAVHALMDLSSLTVHYWTPGPDPVRVEGDMHVRDAVDLVLRSEDRAWVRHRAGGDLAVVSTLPCESVLVPVLFYFNLARPSGVLP